MTGWHFGARKIRVSPNISVRRSMMSKRDLRLIVMFLCLKKVMPADDLDIHYEVRQSSWFNSSHSQTRVRFSDSFTTTGISTSDKRLKGYQP